jgi:hypothetical protein
MLGSLVGGMIVLTNTRTLLKSDWIDAADPVRYTVYGLLYAVWAVAVVHSYRQYRKDRAVESVEAVAVIAETNNVVADVARVDAPMPAPSPVPAGRPSAPRD